MKNSLIVSICLVALTVGVFAQNAAAQTSSPAPDTSVTPTATAIGSATCDHSRDGRFGHRDLPYGDGLGRFQLEPGRDSIPRRARLSPRLETRSEEERQTAAVTITSATWS